MTMNRRNMLAGILGVLATPFTVRAAQSAPAATPVETDDEVAIELQYGYVARGKVQNYTVEPLFTEGKMVGIRTTIQLLKVL